MNHIVRLQTDLAVAHAALAAKDDAVRAFRAHLASDKFAGFDADGERRDWIATSDVERWLATITQAGAEA